MFDIVVTLNTKIQVFKSLPLSSLIIFNVCMLFGFTVSKTYWKLLDVIPISSTISVPRTNW